MVGKTAAKQAAPPKGKDPKGAVQAKEETVEEDRPEPFPNYASLDFQKAVKYDLAIA